MVSQRPETVVVTPQPPHSQRDVGLHVYEGTEAVKTLRCHPHNGYCLAVQAHLSADDLQIGVEAFLPVVITKHDYGLGAWPLRFFAVNQASGRRLQSQSLKEIAAHLADHHRLGAAGSIQAENGEVVS